MTYLPKSSGSEEENAEQAEELEVRFYKYLVKLNMKYLILILVYCEEKVMLYNEVNMCNKGPGRVSQLVRASSWYTKVAGLIPGQGTYKNQPVSA